MGRRLRPTKCKYSVTVQSFIPRCKRHPIFLNSPRMTASIHRYERQFDTDSGDSLARLVRWIPHGSCVLELGPAGGYFTRYLHDSLGCTVDAVELDPTMADAARPWCRTMLVGNLDALSLHDLLPHADYDVILIADVLEHLRDPETLLNRLAHLLKPAGRCLISVPNIAYGGLIAGLLQGNFDYRAEGLLDSTHVRFFTRRSLARTLEATGWHPWAWEAVTLPYWASEFRLRIETLPRTLADFLNEAPELHCYQWLVQARRTPSGLSPTLPDSWPDERFPIRLFWACAAETFDYTRSQVVWGKIGADRQVQSFVLKDSISSARFRLRLADRPGFMRLHRVSLLADNGESVWQWIPTDGIDALCAQCLDVRLADTGDQAIAVLDGSESWLDLRGCNEQTPVRSVEVVCSWPESADFAAARAGWEAATLPLRNELDSIKVLVATRDIELASRDAQLATQHSLLIKENEHLYIQELEILSQARTLQIQANELETLKLSAEQQSAQITTLQSQVVRMQTFAWWLKRPLHWLRKLV